MSLVEISFPSGAIHLISAAASNPLIEQDIIWSLSIVIPLLCPVIATGIDGCYHNVKLLLSIENVIFSQFIYSFCISHFGFQVEVQFYLLKTFNITSVLTSVASSLVAGVIRHLYVESTLL